MLESLAARLAEPGEPLRMQYLLWQCHCFGGLRREGALSFT